ncbi:protein ALP1-like [Exaiptasia diaphana]|uniref:DDE Tnp4 domain-containing protein n=1 Tax=Exaiptasia diaphana TaxID=2652724 RepID=A0A913YPU5_EXADI|nr:protein ALP1-like [Exaiptasia diaphana]
MHLNDLQLLSLLYVLLSFTFTAGNIQRAVLLACIQRNRALRLQILTTIRRRHAIQRRRRRRRFWMLPRPRVSWFEMFYRNCVIPDEYFKEQLRLKTNTFELLLNVLRPALTRQNTFLRDCIPPAKVLSLGLYRLAHGNSYNTIAATFNVGKSTVIEAVQDVVEALCDIRENYIKFPSSEDEIVESSETFDDLTDIPNVVGAIDGTHIRIKKTNDSGPDYFSRYQQYDVVVQGVVNGDKKFIHVAAGFPGSMHDARVFKNSSLYHKIATGEFLQAPTVRVENRDIKPLLLGDSAYPLTTFILKPYPENTRDPKEVHFNKELSRARVSVECAFGMLKGRWRILQKRLDSNIAFVSKIITACCVLHNFCLDADDVWDVDDDNQNHNAAFQNIDAGGEDLRDFLKNYVWSL